MRFLVLIFISISLTFGNEIRLREGIKPQKFPPVVVNNTDLLLKRKWEDLANLVEHYSVDPRAGSIEADLTEYTLAILTHISEVIVHSGYDPLELSDQHLSLFPGSLDLSNGWLQDLSTITVYDEVVAKYTRADHLFELTLPIAFNQILIDYNYHVQIVLLGISGTVDAKVSNLKLNLHMGFNFTSYQAFVDNIDVKDSGSIQIKFTGLGLLDWVVELLTNAVIGVFHNLILGIVNLIIYNPVNEVVETINNIIYEVLHPNSTSVAY